MKHSYSFLLIHSLFFWTINSANAQDNGNKKCFESTKVKSKTSYHIWDVNDTASTRYRKTDFDKYDRWGNQILWRQFDSSDSTKYSDRLFEYNKNAQLVKMTNAPEDASGGIIDSVGFDKTGCVNYRKMFRPSGEILFETKIRTERNSKNKPSKISFYDTQGNLGGYTLVSYNEQEKISKEISFMSNDSIVEKNLYSYYSNDTLKEIKKYKAIKGMLLLLEIDKFNESGQLQEEVHYDQDKIDKLSYKISRKYDKQHREIENTNYTFIFDQWSPTRRETSDYNNLCLKIKTKIYSIDSFSKKEALYTIVKYQYEFYQQ